MGGVIIGYEIGKILKKVAIFSERIDNKFLLRRDFSIPKKSNVLIVEDVITTGKSSIECAQLAINSDANIIGYACIIDRSDGNSLIKKKIVSQIEFNIPTFTKDDMPENLKSIKAVKPGSRNL